MERSAYVHGCGCGSWLDISRHGLLTGATMNKLQKQVGHYLEALAVGVSLTTGYLLFVFFVLNSVVSFYVMAKFILPDDGHVIMNMMAWFGVTMFMAVVIGLALFLKWYFGPILKKRKKVLSS